MDPAGGRKPQTPQLAHPWKKSCGRSGIHLLLESIPKPKKVPKRSSGVEETGDRKRWGRGREMSSGRTAGGGMAELLLADRATFSRRILSELLARRSSHAECHCERTTRPCGVRTRRFVDSDPQEAEYPRTSP